MPHKFALAPVLVYIRKGPNKLLVLISLYQIQKKVLADEYHQLIERCIKFEYIYGCENEE